MSELLRLPLAAAVLSRLGTSALLLVPAVVLVWCGSRLLARSSAARAGSRLRGLSRDADARASDEAVSRERAEVGAARGGAGGLGGG